MPPVSTDPDLQALLAQSRSSVDGSDAQIQTASEQNQVRMGQDRSRIALIIIGTYALAILGAILFIVATVPDCTDPSCTGDESAWNQQAELLMSLIVTAVVPVVTLMLGFYFGSEKANDVGNGG